MSSYNTLTTLMSCPRCGNSSLMEIDLYFGHRGQFQYTVGSKVEWLKVQSVAEGGRPENGTMAGEGYSECASCKKDFFASVIVQNDRIVGVAVDHRKSGYVSD